MLADAIVGILGFVLYLLLMGVVAVAVLLALVGGIGVVGAILSTPLLYVFPDVRRFLESHTGEESGSPSSPRSVVLRRRYLLLCLKFGLGYGLTFILVYAPIKELGLVGTSVGPVPLLAIVPLLYSPVIANYGYRRHRRSNAWRPAATERTVFLQWLVFVSVAALVGVVPLVIAVSV